MHIVVTSEQGEVFNFEIDENELVENVKALIEVETNILLVDQILLFNNVELKDNQKLKESGVKNDDLLQVIKKNQDQLLLLHLYLKVHRIWIMSIL